MTDGLHCPKCGRELVKDFYEGRIRFRCSAGHGECMTVSGVRSLCGNPKFVGELWQNAYYNAPAGSVSCPVCRRSMKVVNLPVDGRNMELDVCCSCQEIWFDPKELAALPVCATPPAEELPPEARELLARHQIERIAREAEATPEDPLPDNVWEFLAALCGFPVKGGSASEGRSYVTWGAVLLCVAVFLLTGCGSPGDIEDWGFIPAEPWRRGGLTILTSMLMHAGWGHLAGNMYFLLVFGGDVENAFGRLKYLSLIMLSGACAVLFHCLAAGHSAIPCIGASGFISGVLAAYATAYPRVRVSFLLRGGFRAAFLKLPAWAAFLLWLIFQLAMAAATRGIGGGVAYSAHLGGAVAGLIFGVCMRYFRQREADDFARRCDDMRRR